MTSHNNTAQGHVARTHRQAGAIARAASRSLRSTDEQIVLIQERPGTSVREVDRLLGRNTTGERPSRQKRAKRQAHAS